MPGHVDAPDGVATAGSGPSVGIYREVGVVSETTMPWGVEAAYTDSDTHALPLGPEARAFTLQVFTALYRYDGCRRGNARPRRGRLVFRQRRQPPAGHVDVLRAMALRGELWSLPDVQVGSSVPLCPDVSAPR